MRLPRFKNKSEREGKAFSPRRGREEKAPRALLVEGTTQVLGKKGDVSPHKIARVFCYAFATFLVAFGLLRYAVERATAPTVAVPAAEISAPSPTSDELKQAYEAKVPDILKRLNDGLSAPASADRFAAVTKTRQDLLALTVPLVYKDFHLSLVIALSKIESGERGDQQKLKDGLAALQSMTAAYPWLAGYGHP